MADEQPLYKLKCLSGTTDFVLQELISKFPDIAVLEKGREEIQFLSTIVDIEQFRILHSPTHISNDDKILNLSKPKWRRGFVPAGINPSLAYIMCMIANLSTENILYDPFCGSSVIAVTAIKEFNVKRVMCSDISNKAILQSNLNFESAGIENEKYKLFKGDISKLKLNKRNIDRIVSNLPFGIREGNHQGNVQAYRDLANLAQRVLRKQGLLVLLTQEKKLIYDTFKKDIWNVKSVASVEQGGLNPDIFLIQSKTIS